MALNGKLNGTSNGNGSKPPVRFELIHVNIFAVIAAVGFGVIGGGAWMHARDVAAAQHGAIEEIRSGLKGINDNLMAVRKHQDATTNDRWRGRDMREWSSAAEKMNEGFSAPEIDSLPGYARRNDVDGRLRQ